MEPYDSFESSEDQGRRRKVLFAALLVIVVGGSALMLFKSQKGSLMPEEAAWDTEAEPGSQQSVQLYFGDAAGDRLEVEDREMATAMTFEEQVESVIRELIEGPKDSGLVAVMPKAARLTEVFYNDRLATLYLDFSTSLLTQHPGGSTAEYYTITAVLRTLGANFPQVRHVQLLVDGQPVDSLAGHFDTSKPLAIATWQ